jgi:hypothetical protein
MFKRDDAISIKELKNRSGASRTRVYKTIIRGWQQDPIKKDFIFQVEAPGTKTGYAWFIKKPAVSLAIKTLNDLSPTKQDTLTNEQEQGIRKRQGKTSYIKGQQEQGNLGLRSDEINQLKIQVEDLTKTVADQSATIDKLVTNNKVSEDRWHGQIEKVWKLLTRGKDEEPTPAEKQSDINNQMQQQEALPINQPSQQEQRTDNIPDLAIDNPQVQTQTEPKPQPQNPPIESYEPQTPQQEVGDTPQKLQHPETSANTGFSDNSYAQRQENNISL